MRTLDDLSVAVEMGRAWLAGRQPELAIILGSGFSDLLLHVEDLVSRPYLEFPGFPATGVAGHAGMLHAGTLFGCAVLIFQGRYHVYEGYSAWQVTAPVRLAADLGCRKILLTNSAGAIAARMVPGDFMLVSDHINFTGHNPLIGKRKECFIDLQGLYVEHFAQPLQRALQSKKIELHSGVLAWMTGPSYETPAEIRMLEKMGADAVSMSTIPEAIIAGYLNVETVALSFLSNLAAGKGSALLLHDDVLASGREAANEIGVVFETLIPLWFRPT